MPVKRLTVSQVEGIAYKLAQEMLKWDEPIPEFGSRFPGVLESCLAVPFQSFGGQPAYDGLVAQAAILFYLMIKNHPFINGNKRLAMTTMLCLLHINGKWLRVEVNNFYLFTRRVAQSEARAKNQTIVSVTDFIGKFLVEA